MSRPASRKGVRSWVTDPAKMATCEPPPPGTGVREWIDGLEKAPALCAAFDTRMDSALILSGPASGRIENELTKRGSLAVLPAVSFLLSKQTVLEDGELSRARAWGSSIGEAAGLTVQR